MSGSRLGRGRVGRLALVTCSAIGTVFLIFFYRSMSSEMARLHDLHLKCTQQQEALTAQLQVIYEYKLQLEKTLSNEKSANAAAKEELQKKASRERSIRDKDIVEAMQRFNSLQQNYKLLQTEHQDLKEDCRKKEAVALQDSKRLESTLQDLRVQLKKAGDNKEKYMEHLKTKYMELANQKDQLEENYNNLKKISGDNNGNVEHLEKQVIQLQRELHNVKKSPHFSISAIKNENGQILSRHEVNLRNVDSKRLSALENNQIEMIRPSSQQQVSSSSDILQVVQNPQPLQAPQSSRHFDGDDTINVTRINSNVIDRSYNSRISLAKNNSNSFKFDDFLPNEPKSDIRFENRNGNIVPVGPNDVKNQYEGLPILNAQQQKPLSKNVNEISEEKMEQTKQVLVPPNDAEKLANGMPRNIAVHNNLSSKGPLILPILKPQAAGQSNEIDDHRDSDDYSNHFV